MDVERSTITKPRGRNQRVGTIREVVKGTQGFTMSLSKMGFFMYYSHEAARTQGQSM